MTVENAQKAIADREQLKSEVERMLSYSERVNSFASWPYAGTLAPEKMAAVGWYQSGPLCCRHVISLKELDGWDGDEDPIQEVKKRTNNPLLSHKWSPGISALAKRDDEILVGTRYRLMKLQGTAFMITGIEETEEWQEQRKAQMMERIKEKYSNEEEAIHHIERFRVTIGIKMADQLNGMKATLEKYERINSSKFKVKKGKPKVAFSGSLEEANLAEVATERWIDIFPENDENVEPSGALPKPLAAKKSRQSMLAPNVIRAEPPSARKAKNDTRRSK